MTFLPELHRDVVAGGFDGLNVAGLEDHDFAAGLNDETREIMAAGTALAERIEVGSSRSTHVFFRRMLTNLLHGFLERANPNGVS